jgi:threo-3-hydroxy-L-aspartate ammonia-lyase
VSDENLLGLPTAADVTAAATRIEALIHRTPVITCRTIDAAAGRAVMMKAEHLQKTGAYKSRGATNQVRGLLERGVRVPGVVAASSGNHGQAVAWAAREGGIPATIVVPETIAVPKRAAIEGYGARVVVAGRENEERLAVTAGLVANEGLVDIPPYDHPLTIGGQGTWVLEALEDSPTEPETIVVPIGGGGLAAGTNLAVEGAGRRGTIAVYGVEPEGADETRRSILAGERVTVERPASIADALLANRPGELTFAINRERLAGALTVSDEEIIAAMRLLWERAKQVVEPSGAAALAAVLAARVPGEGPVLVVLSGGNVDLERFRFGG